MSAPPFGRTDIRKRHKQHCEGRLAAAVWIRMRITYLHQYFNTPTMTGPARSFELGRRLVERGHQVNMITTCRDVVDRTDWDVTDEAGIKTHWLPVPYSNAMGKTERLRAFWRFATAAARRAADIPADVIYATSTPLTIALPGAYAAFRRKIPMVFEVRDLWPDVPQAMGLISNPLLVFAGRRLEAFAYSAARKIIVLTPSMRDFVSGKGVPLEKIDVISNGANPSRFDGVGEAMSGVAARLPDEHRVLIYCGSLGPAHGPEYLCDLAEAFLAASLNVQILVVGDGKLRPALERRSEDAGTLGETIHFVGSATQTELPALYRRADAAIMTIADCELLYRHSVQNKFFESLAAGLPIFANYRGWASELAEQTGSGVILPKQNTDAAAHTIADHLADRAWTERSSAAARDLLAQRFDFELLTDKLEEALQSVVARSVMPGHEKPSLEGDSRG